jgi:hypothetical protein
MKNSLDQKLALLVKGIAIATNAFVEQSAKANKKYVEMREKVRDELKTTFKALNKNYKKLGNAYNELTGSLKTAAGDITRNGMKLSQALRDIVKDSEGTKAKTPGDNPVSTSSKEKKSNDKGSKGRSRKKDNKGAKRERTKRNIGKKYNPNNGRPDTEKKGAPKNNSTPPVATDSNGGSVGKLDAFNKMADNINNMQGTVLNIMKGVDQAAKSGDFKPLAAELAKIPGPIGKVAEVALQSYEIGNKLYDWYMEYGGGNERDAKDFKGKQNVVNNELFSDKEKDVQQKRKNKFSKDREYLVKNGVITEDESKQYQNDFDKEKHTGKLDTAVKIGKMKENHEKFRKDKAKLTPEQSEKLEQSQNDFSTWKKGEESNIQDAVKSGNIEANSVEYFAMFNKLQLQAIEKLRTLAREYQKLGANFISGNFSKQADKASQDFQADAYQRKNAIEQRRDDDILGKAGKGDKLGQTNQAMLDRSNEELAVYKSELDILERNDAPDKSQKRQEIKKKISTKTEEIKGIKRAIAQEQSVATRTNVVSNTSGFGGDLPSQNSTLPVSPKVPGRDAAVRIGLNSTKYNPAALAAKARAPMYMQNATGLAQQSNQDIHRTLKQVKDILNARLPRDSF